MNAILLTLALLGQCRDGRCEPMWSDRFPMPGGYESDGVPFGAGFNPTIPNWISMPEDTPEERKDKEKARLLWAKQSRQLRGIQMAQERKQRVVYNNVTHAYDRQQQANNNAIGAALNYNWLQWNRGWRW